MQQDATDIGINSQVLGDLYMRRLLHSCATLNVRWVYRLPSALQSAVWAGPTAARNPEGELLWHPVHGGAGVSRKVLHYVSSLIWAAAAGVYRATLYRGVGYKLIRRGSPILLVVPQAICERCEPFRSSYIIETDEHKVDRLVLDCVSPDASRRRLTGRERGLALLLLLRGLIAGLRDLASERGIVWADVDATVMFAAWIASHAWCRVLDTERLLESHVDSRRYHAVMALHEMHPYSRVLWRVANRVGVRAITAQHAVIIPEKLWYFPAAIEREAGCAVPNIFFVYSTETAGLLKPSYPCASFPLCCSPRFASWRQRRPRADIRLMNTTPMLLLASGAIFHDVAVILRAAKVLAASGVHREWQIRLRLHPDATVPLRWRLWLRRATRRGQIQASKRPLGVDIESATLVSGAYSTVIQEALLNGVPVLGLTTGKYTRPSTFPARLCDIGELSAQALQRAAESEVAPDTVATARRLLGLEHEDLSTGRVYDVCRETVAVSSVIT